MGKLKIISSLLLVAGVFSLLVSGVAGAFSFNSGDNVNISQETTINNTVFAAGQTVDISANVSGDVFCAGQTVTISGNVDGDVVCAGQTVNITGDVTGDVRIAGQTITVDGVVKGSATIAGQTFTLGSKGKVGRDLSLGSTNGNLNGAIGRDVLAGGNSLDLSGAVGRDIIAGLSDLKIGSGAVVKGNIEYTSSNEAEIDDTAKIGGEVTRNEPSSRSSTASDFSLVGFGVGLFIYLFFAMLLVAMALALLFPKLLHNATQHALDRPWRVLLVGVLATFFAPFVLFIIAITIVGLPLAIIVGLAWMLIALLSGVFSAYTLGRLMLRESTNALVIMLAGASALLVSYFIPFVGFLTALAAFWFGVGMILTELFQRTPKPKYDISKVKKS